MLANSMRMRHFSSVPAAVVPLLQVGAAPLVDFFESVVPPEVAAAAAENWKRERTEAALAAVR